MGRDASDVPVISNLSGFGCRILAYDPGGKRGRSVTDSMFPLEELWKEADVITMHTPLTEENFHLVNEKTLSQMKDGVADRQHGQRRAHRFRGLIAGIENGENRRGRPGCGGE